MPQMAPLNWLTLMLTFIMIFLMFNIMNYYSFTYNNVTKKMSAIKNIKINWKW
uniref:ATP synthase F0 subunit 8 n=1 Tax=Myladina unguiculina TaxID=3037634 RepID=UPI0024355764|nr:ATP synthase F0 subunit 8 [Myladina unguiculina]WEX49722.1 ATP synthase F0 subunit 8 [Myladina unguiculina]